MRNEKPLKTRVLISSIILMFMVLCDIYMIASVPKNFQLLAIAAFITFLWMTFTLDGWMSLRDLGTREREEQYQDILKAEKASYLIFQQKFQDLDNKLNFIGQKVMQVEKVANASQKRLASMLDGLSEDQKKVAKITISRSKENADALISSNGQVLKQMGTLLQAVDHMEGVDGLPQAGVSPQELQSLKGAHDEIMERLQEIAHLLGSDTPLAHQGTDQFSQKPQTTPMPANEDTGGNLSQGELEALLSGMEEPAQASSQASEEKLDTPESQDAEEQPASSEPQVEVQPALSEPQAEVQPASPEPQAEVQPASPEPQAEVQPASPGPQAEVQPASPEPQADSASQAAKGQTVKPSQPAKEQPVKESPKAQASQTPAKPNPADPNKMMSPEDIAALIANTAVEDLPETTVQAEEEKPPKPDASDPNKMMSPEDIAALIANM